MADRDQDLTVVIRVNYDPPTEEEGAFTDFELESVAPQCSCDDCGNCSTCALKHEVNNVGVDELFGFSDGRVPGYVEHKDCRMELVGKFGYEHIQSIEGDDWDVHFDVTSAKVLH